MNETNVIFVLIFINKYIIQLGMLAQVSNPRTGEAEAGRCLSLRSTGLPSEFQDIQAICREKLSRNTKSKKKNHLGLESYHSR